MRRRPEAHFEQGRDQLRLPVTLIVAAVVVIGALVLLISARPRLEQGMSNLGSMLPVGYAFAAGMVASVNPCGALMLPSYIFFQLQVDEQAPPSMLDQLLRALRVATTATGGFALVFGAAGIVISAGGRWLIGLFPYAGLLIGGLMVVLGVWLLASHREVGILAASRVAVTPRRTLGNVFLFGAAYGISSLSCTLPIFLVVVGSALSTGLLTASVAQFMGYALGMGAVLAVITVGTALFREVIERWLRRLVPHVHRVSALFLVGAGAYLVYYWLVEVGLLG